MIRICKECGKEFDDDLEGIYCKKCGKNICMDCQYYISGKGYCVDCYEAAQAAPTGQQRPAESEAENE